MKLKLYLVEVLQFKIQIEKTNGHKSLIFPYMERNLFPKFYFVLYYFILFLDYFILKLASAYSFLIFYFFAILSVCFYAILSVCVLLLLKLNRKYLYVEHNCLNLKAKPFFHFYLFFIF